IALLVTKHLERSSQLPLAAIDQEQIRRPPGFYIFFAKPPRQHFTHMSKIIIARQTHFEFSVGAFIRHTVGKYHHTGDGIGARHMADVKPLDSPQSVYSPGLSCSRVS